MHTRHVVAIHFRLLNGSQRRMMVRGKYNIEGFEFSISDSGVVGRLSLNADEASIFGPLILMDAEGSRAVEADSHPQQNVTKCNY